MLLHERTAEELSHSHDAEESETLCDKFSNLERFEILCTMVLQGIVCYHVENLPLERLFDNCKRLLILFDNGCQLCPLPREQIPYIIVWLHCCQNQFKRSSSHLLIAHLYAEPEMMN